MSRAQSPTGTRSPLHPSSEDLMTKLLTQMDAITLSLDSLRKGNVNRVEEISKLAQRVGCTGEIETDKDGVNPRITNGSSTDDEEVQAQERIGGRNEQISDRFKQRYRLPTLYSKVKEKITTIRTYDELFESLRQNLKHSTQALRN